MRLLALVPLLTACAGSPTVPCAAPAVASYTARMIAAGCTGEHFDDVQCGPIKQQRDADEKGAGCK